MNNLLHLSPALTICDPVASDHAVESKRFRLPDGVWSSLRSFASSFRHEPSLSEQSIATTSVNDLLRRH